MKCIFMTNLFRVLKNTSYLLEIWLNTLNITKSAFFFGSREYIKNEGTSGTSGLYA